MSESLQAQCRRTIRHLLLLSILGTTGCASITSGTTQSVFVNSSPSGANVEVDGLQATTPAKLELKRNQASHNVRVTKEGYEPANVSIGRKFNPWVAGNLLWGHGFLVGVVVDFVSGGAWDLDTDRIDLTLSPDEKKQ